MIAFPCFGGNERRRNLGKEGCAYYLTKGWMNSDSGIATEYNRCAMKYGHEKSQMVFKIMLKGYRSLDVINTGVDKLHELIEAARGFADILDLDYKAWWRAHWMCFTRLCSASGMKILLL
ncbi:MAG: DUF1638 domain-containing protein [Syntrophaceticus schinkii]